jgi:hypothetical protein
LGVGPSHNTQHKNQHPKPPTRRVPTAVLGVARRGAGAVARPLGRASALRDTPSLTVGLLPRASTLRRSRIEIGRGVGRTRVSLKTGRFSAVLVVLTVAKTHLGTPENASWHCENPTRHRENASRDRENAARRRENASQHRENAARRFAKTTRHAANAARRCESPARKFASAIRRSADTTRQLATSAQHRENPVRLIANAAHHFAEAGHNSANTILHSATRTPKFAKASHYQKTRARFSRARLTGAPARSNFPRDGWAPINSEWRAGFGANLNLITKEIEDE